jgi:imidazolonepropionase-like amidohydrolase
MNMRRVLPVGVLLILLTSTVAAQLPTPTLVIRNGTLIDGTGRPPVEGATIFVSGNRITRVATGEVTLPAGIRVIDATGLTILPGLMDMHIHHRPWMWPLFLQFGVTTVRDVGSDPDLILRDRDRERRGELTAPRIFACGPLLDGDPPVWGTAWRGSVALTSVDQARAVAQRLLDRGVDCLKVYARLPSALMRAIVELAAARDVPVTGHVGAVSARDAAEMGVRSIEHASGIIFPMPPEVQELLVRVLVERGTFIVATMLVEENFANLPTIGNARYPFLSLVPADETRGWLNWPNDFRLRDTTAEAFARRRARVAAKAAFIRAFHRAGGKVVAGSDTPNPFVVPGISLHQELESLVAAGLSPMDAIMSATSVAAALLRRADLGTVEEGKLADLVLVSGNPASDIAATCNIRVVIKGGALVHERR